MGVMVLACAVLGLLLCGSLRAADIGRDNGESRKMRGLLRPYLDPDYAPTEGPDQDKEFIREYTADIKGALPEGLSVPDAPKRRILVLTRGTMGPLHSPGAAGLLIMLRGAAEKYDAFELTEVYTDEFLDAEALSDFDAVVLNNLSQAGNHAFYNEVLPQYVRNGGALFAVHSSALPYRDQPEAEYNKLLGSYVDSVNTKYGHPSKHGKPFPVRLPDHDHPLAAAFKGEGTPRTVTHRCLAGKERRKYQVNINPPKTLADELYALIRTDGQENPPQVLAEVNSDEAVQVYPETADEFAYALAWIKQYGKGRVYYAQFGHNMGVCSVPCIAEAMLDGLQYVAGDLTIGEGIEGDGAIIAKCEWVVFNDVNRPRKLPALRIETEDGADGYWVGDYLPGRGLDSVHSLLEKLRGQDASDPETLWDRMGEMGFPHFLRMAVDIAVWDRYGRARGKSLAQLLGPRKRDKVALYIAALSFDLEGNVRTARGTKERGIQGYKIYTYLKGRGQNRDTSKTEEAEVWLEQDIGIARAVHEAVGDSLSLMFYNGCSYDLEQATRVGKVLDELAYDVFYDPMPAPGGDSLESYLSLQKTVRTPICAPISGGDAATRVRWMEEQAVDINEIDVYAGFTPCLRLVRACEKAGVPLDLHGGFINDIYQFSLYPIVDDHILPWIGLHHPAPQHIPVAKEFPGSKPGHEKRPWIKRIQARPVDSEGYVHLNYELPGMAVELDWDWIQHHATD